MYIDNDNKYEENKLCCTRAPGFGNNEGSAANDIKALICLD